MSKYLEMEEKLVHELNGWRLNFAVAVYCCKYEMALAEGFRANTNPTQRIDKAPKLVLETIDGEPKFRIVEIISHYDFSPVENIKDATPVFEKLNLRTEKDADGYWVCRVDGFELFKDDFEHLAKLRAAVALSAGVDRVQVPALPYRD